ncbi:polymorphic toxin-type HINT domain-containing protein [Streptosporangium sandarakinum]
MTGSAHGLPPLVDSSATATPVKETQNSSRGDSRPDKGTLPIEDRLIEESTPKAVDENSGVATSDARRAERRGAAESIGATTMAASTVWCEDYPSWDSTKRYGYGDVVRWSSGLWKVTGFNSTVGTPPDMDRSWVYQGACSFHRSPAVNDMVPADEALVESRTPTLQAWGSSNDYFETPVTFAFKVCDNEAMTGTGCVSSGVLQERWSHTRSWQVPAGKLTWSKQYWWTVTVTDTASGLKTTSKISFTTGVHQPVIGSQLAARGANGQEFHQVPGNYTTETTDLSVNTAGPSLSVTRSYNSMDARTDGLFGAGWSTRWDMKLVHEVHGELVSALITYPDGRRVRFIANDDGSYQPPPGMYATLAEVQGGGWRLMDKSSTSYLFDAQGRITKITDARGRAQDFVYQAGGKLEKVTATGGRSLTFTWDGAHVASVSSDPGDGAAVTWTYHYEGDKLTAACAPVAAPNCTRYAYGSGSQYRGIVQDTEPYGYWRLGDEGGSAAADLGSNGESASYEEGVVNGKPGALAGSTDTAVELADGLVRLPDYILAHRGEQASAELWFKTAASGVLLAANATYSDVPQGPMLYVGTDGKLRGAFEATATPMTSTGVVNDDQWHHAVLTLAGDQQVLYLDGQQIGTMTAQVNTSRPYAAVGNGIITRGSAPGLPTGTGTQEFPFRGLLDEAAIYGKPLTAAEVALHYAARTEAPHKLTKITLPSGRVWATNTYDAGTERITTHTDRHGGTWKLGVPKYASTTGKSTITVTDPNNNTLSYVHDAWRGYRLVSQTDQLGKVTKYAYDTGGFLRKITDSNDNFTERVNDKRGNVTEVRTCRSSASCQSRFQSFHLNSTDEFDPRNDRMIVSRDARSSGAADNTYATTWEYTAQGDVVKETTPATPGFSDGRSAIYTYTDGTEPAIGGGNTPAGLVKSTKDAKGNETTYRYTSAGDLAEQTSPSGLLTKLTYDAVGRMLTRTEVSEAHPTGATTTFTYDGLGRMLTQTGPGVKNEVTNVTHTAKVTYTYDSDGNKLTETLSDLTGGDPERATTYTYDASGRVETVTDPEGGVVRTAWDTTGARTSATDQVGTVYTFGYTKRGEPATTTLKNWTGSPVSPQPAKDVVLESRSYDPGGRLAAQVDAMGRKASYTYFADNLLSQVIADDVKLNGTTTPVDVVLENNTYDAAGNLTKQVTGDGKTTVDYVYDAAGRMAASTLDPAALKRKTAFEYDAVDNVIKETYTGAGTARTESTLYAYNALNQVTRQTVENGDDDLITTSTYDDRGLLVATTDPRGNASGATAADFTTEMRYDIAGQLVEKISPKVKVEKTGAASDAHPVEKYGYDVTGQLTQAVDPEGRTLTSAFDKAGRLISMAAPSYTPPGGEAVVPKIVFGYDAAGRKTKVTDERGYITSADYDALDNLVRVTDPGPSGPGGQWVTEFDLLGEPLAVIDPTGARAEATYDDLGRMITQTQIERRPTTAAYTTTLTYDAAGNLTKSVAPGNKITGYTVNAAGEITAATDPNTNKSTVDYDLAGRTVKVTDPLGNATEAVYDLAGRQTGAKDLDATGTVVRTLGFGYDAAGNLTSSTSGEGHVTRRMFDALDRMTSLIEPVSADKSITTTFGYDAAGARARLTDGRGNATWTTYNTLRLAESVIEPATAAHGSAADRTWTTLYDAAGNAVTTLQPGGVRINRAFDPLGQVTKQTGAGATVDTPERNLTYDAAGRLTAIGDYTLEYNDRSLLTKVSKATIQVATYAYDGLGNTTQRVDTAGTATYTYDAASRLKTATDPVTGRTWTYGYDNADRLTSQTSANPANTQSYTYDAVDRLTSQTLKNGSGTQLSKISYDWDKDDNLVTKITSGTAGAGVNTYGYDHSGRLTSWTAPDGKATAYEWDDAGNRTKAGDKTFVYDERNRLLSGGGTEYTYTARGTVATETTGGVTKNLVFDAFDQLISDGDATYGYDALGRMTSRTKGATQQRFVYSGLSNDIVTVTDGVGALQAKYGRDLWGGLLSLQEGDGPALGTMTDLHGDLVGTFSGTALVDSVAYDPFGEVLQSTGTKRTLGYQGEYTDPDSGKVNMHARWYRPGSGTFTSRDSWTLNSSPSIQANRWTYGNGSPMVNADPSGHASIPACIWPWHPLCPRVTIEVKPKGPQGPCKGPSDPRGCWVDRNAPVGNSPHSCENPRSTQCGNGGGGGGKSGTLRENPRSVPRTSPPASPKTDPVKHNPCYSCGHSAPKKPKPRPKPNPPYKPDFNPNSKSFRDDPNNVTVDRDSPQDIIDYQCRTGPCTGSYGGHEGINIIGSTGDGGGWSSCRGWSSGSCGGLEPMVPTMPLVPDVPTISTIPEDPPSPLDSIAGYCTEVFICDVFIGDPLNCVADPSFGSCAPAVIGVIPVGKAATAVFKLGSKAAKYARRAGNACKRNSFVPGTLVLMADGTRKPIEDVEVGDQVVAADPETGQTAARRVSHLIVGNGEKHLVRVVVGSSDGTASNDASVTATDGHPFWVVNLHAWVKASELLPGMVLRTGAGTYVQIKAIKKWTTTQRVHNLTVDGLHTYHVLAGDQAVLVHNDNGPHSCDGVDIYRTPRDGQMDYELNNGPNPALHQDGDRSAYFGERSVAEEYRGHRGYSDSCIRYCMDRRFLDEFGDRAFRYDWKGPNGSPRIEFVIPVDRFGRFNELTRDRSKMD